MFAGAGGGLCWGMPVGRRDASGAAFDGCELRRVWYSVRNRGGVVSHRTEVGLKLKNNLDHATITALSSMPPGTPSADLTINKTAPVTVGQGARVTCTMTVSNKVPQPSAGLDGQIPDAIVHPSTSTPG